MIDFRSHLWDIFVYIGVGALTVLMIGTHDILFGTHIIFNIVDYVAKLPAALSVILAPTVLMVVGALVEPLANLLEKGVLRAWKMGTYRAPQSDSGDALEIYIRRNFTDSILGENVSPYNICKEYVETHNLSRTFMPFLAKFGFYRSTAFCFFSFSVIVGSKLVLGGVRDTNASIVAVVCFLLGVIYLLRSRQFFSYQAPSVYAAFVGPVISGILHNNEHPTPE